MSLYFIADKIIGIICLLKLYDWKFWQKTVNGGCSRQLAVTWRIYTVDMVWWCRLWLYWLSRHHITSLHLQRWSLSRKGWQDAPPHCATHGYYPSSHILSINWSHHCQLFFCNAIIGTNIFEELVNQYRNIISPFIQRRHMNDDNTKAMVKIKAEMFLHLLLSAGLYW